MLGKELTYSMPTPFHLTQALSSLHFPKLLINFLYKCDQDVTSSQKPFLTLSVCSDAQITTSTPQVLKVTHPEHIFNRNTKLYF